jgi:hypothetical protein
MKVFLSTAITRGRREYVDAVNRIRGALHDAGADVLNERVSDPNFPAPDVDTAATIRELQDWLQQADALIAEATISSTGVGCEVTTVQMRGKPVLLLYDAHFGFRISDWVFHHPGPNVESHAYRDQEEIAGLVADFLGRIRG